MFKNKYLETKKKYLVMSGKGDSKNPDTVLQTNVNGKEYKNNMEDKNKLKEINHIILN